MSQRAIKCIAVSFVAIGSVAFLQAQPDFHRTKVVDPSATDFANFNDIQDAIADIGEPEANDHWTVLIYPGVYTIDDDEHLLIHLGGDDERISLVGVDRQSVIIKVTTAGSGIKITSGDETSRDCRIANLTIQTTNGHGIEIEKGGNPVPKDIIIENVTIEAGGSGMEGITGADAEEVRIFDSDVTSANGDGIVLGNHWNLTRVKVVTTEDSTIDQNAVVIDDRDFVRMLNCEIIGERDCIWLKSAEDILVRGGQITSKGAGGTEQGNVSIWPGCKRVLFKDCVIISDATGTTRTLPQAVFLDGPGIRPAVEDIVFDSCRLSAIGGDKSTWAIAVKQDIEGTLRLVDCDIRAVNVEDPSDAQASARAVGVQRGFVAGQVLVIGGAITTSTTKTQETHVWDLEFTGTGASHIWTSGTRLSKCNGPIASAERPRPVVQRTIDVDAPDDDWILVQTDLPTSGPDAFQAVDPSNQPDVYRALAVRGVEVGGSFSITGNVFVVGTDWAGNPIAESFDISTGNHEDIGDKPFKTVTKIYLPIHASNVGKVKVGTTSKLGLYFPISAASDVLQQAHKASAATSYTIQSVGTVDATYATVAVGPMTSGDSFEWVVLASQ